MTLCSQRKQRKAFLTMILEAEGTPVLMIDASEGPPLQNAACCIALRTNITQGTLPYVLDECMQPKGACAKDV